MGAGERGVRIVAGEWKGRRLRAPRGDATRPTSDRVREAVFSSLLSLKGADLDGTAVLDAFAGTGAMGLEALSRGAGTATFVENSRGALGALRANIAQCGAGERAVVVAADAFRLASTDALPGGPFGLLLLDPPYRMDAAAVTSLLSDLARLGAVRTGAVAVWEHDSAAEARWPEGFEQAGSKRYGSTAVDWAVFEGGTTP